MPLRHEEEISNPQAKRVWDSFQKEMIPYLLGLLPDGLFSPGREAELFVDVYKRQPVSGRFKSTSWHRERPRVSRLTYLNESTVRDV